MAGYDISINYRKQDVVRASMHAATDLSAVLDDCFARLLVFLIALRTFTEDALCIADCMRCDAASVR